LPLSTYSAAEGMTVSTDWADVRLSADDWAEAFDAPVPGTPHNEAREQIWEELVAILWDRAGLDEDGVSPELFRRSLRQDEELVSTLNRAWPLLDAAELVRAGAPPWPIAARGVTRRRALSLSSPAPPPGTRPPSFPPPRLRHTPRAAPARCAPRARRRGAGHGRAAPAWCSPSPPGAGPAAQPARREPQQEPTARREPQLTPPRPRERQQDRTAGRQAQHTRAPAARAGPWGTDLRTGLDSRGL
jgi:hypothetical protein